MVDEAVARLKADARRRRPRRRGVRADRRPSQGPRSHAARARSAGPRHRARRGRWRPSATCSPRPTSARWRAKPSPAAGAGPAGPSRRCRAALPRALLRQGFGPSAARAALTALGAPDDDTLDDGPAADDPLGGSRHERFSLSRRRTEGGEAPVRQGEPTENIGHIPEGATQPDGMHRRPNAGGSVRCVRMTGTSA